MDDREFWNILASTVMPIKHNAFKKCLPELKVTKKHRLPLCTVLDLHGKTVQEAYDNTLKFIDTHLKSHTKYVLIITGKGKHNQGAIKKEFSGWLTTSKFKKLIVKYEWLNDNGAIRLMLRSKG